MRKHKKHTLMAKFYYILSILSSLTSTRSAFMKNKN